MCVCTGGTAVYTNPCGRWKVKSGPNDVCLTCSDTLELEYRENIEKGKLCLEFH